MKLDAEQVEGLALKLLDGTAMVFPVTAPFVALIKGIIEVADEYGIIPHELPAAQVAAMAAGMAAARASAVTSFRARHPEVSTAPHQERVVTERSDLADKLAKLHAFLTTGVFEGLALVDQGLLVEQETHMAAYLRVLDERIKRFAP